MQNFDWWPAAMDYRALLVEVIEDLDNQSFALTGHRSARARELRELVAALDRR